ncbi:helix-turn-helix domain-containing protein [Pseudotamlana agarivorans]|uniref:helix-turn-helix domain-containing protein n=1 Tax=Pseudotamlana agarivorans TaxID=481183 RepID=UPI00082F6B80|nr:helix-turn-helix domain-containing protein [Tamlana agarivorans]
MNNLNLAQRVKELRNRKGISQEILAEESGLSLRTIQRIENNETVPRGDTLKRLSIALDTSPDEIIDWKIQEDQNYLILLSISALGFLFFPLLGIIIPLAMWMSKKDKLKNVNELGKSILNFQISWTLFLFLTYILLAIEFIISISMDLSISWKITMWQSWFPVTIIFYIFNLTIILINTVRVYRNKTFKYRPALKILK